jgi:hypothetical protein
MSQQKTKSIALEKLTEGNTLVGDCGGHSVVTGEVSKSSVMMGCYAVETEHGTLYLDEEFPVVVLLDS